MVDAYPEANKPTAQMYFEEFPNPFYKATDAYSKFSSVDPGLSMI